MIKRIITSSRVKISKHKNAGNEEEQEYGPDAIVTDRNKRCRGERAY
ncbi:MAG TPA: hypothetical protein VLN91_05935 [Nitrospirota bacterium]|nr:hypothetical protein [Nitrospirota bacterium]